MVIHDNLKIRNDMLSWFQGRRGINRCTEIALSLLGVQYRSLSFHLYTGIVLTPLNM